MSGGERFRRAPHAGEVTPEQPVGRGGPPVLDDGRRDTEKRHREERRERDAYHSTVTRPAAG